MIMNMIFFGTPEFSIPFLKALTETPNVNILATVTQADKPVGRGNKLTSSPVKIFSEKNGILVLSPLSLKNDKEILSRLKILAPDFFVVVAYGKIIPSNMLSIPRFGAINVHPSLLPKYRGPSPMQNAIMNGDKQTGVTIMLLDEGMDTGPLIAKLVIDLSNEETLETLEKKVCDVGPKLLVETLWRFFKGELKPTQQDDSIATITKILTREIGRVDWSQDALSLERKFRAFTTWPGLWTTWKRNNGDEIRLKLSKVTVSDSKKDIRPGFVCIDDGRLLIGSSNGCLEVIEIQPEGKPKMKANAFIQGYSDIDQNILS